MGDPVPILGENRTLHGLGTAWESTKSIRRYVLKEGQLLRWSTKETVGVVNFPTLKLNRQVLEHLLYFWCPQAQDRKTVPIKLVKPQADRAVVFGTSVTIDYQWFLLPNLK